MKILMNMVNEEFFLLEEALSNPRVCGLGEGHLSLAVKALDTVILDDI
jgi:hypothetical protein